MVRFSIKDKSFDEAKKENLHSTMVRFIIFENVGVNNGHVEFTFHYG